MTDITANWHWPQWTWFILAMLSLLVAVTRHGQPRDPHDGFGAIISFGLAVFILASGGFFR